MDSIKWTCYRSCDHEHVHYCRGYKAKQSKAKLDRGCRWHDKSGDLFTLVPWTSILHVHVGDADSFTDRRAALPMTIMCPGGTRRFHAIKDMK
ncbi:MAG: hypothetical protein Q6370_004230 [Candidatus Sigynarchaeota archaeon]